MAATLDDLVDVLKRIVDYLDASTLLSPDAVKVRTNMDEMTFVKQIMDIKGLDETAAKALIASWKA